MVAVDDRLVADAEVVAEATGAIGPLISKSSTSPRAPRFTDAGVVDVVGLGRFDDDAVGVAAATVAAAGAADTRAALVDCGVVVGVGADFLEGVGRAFVC